MTRPPDGGVCPVSSRESLRTLIERRIVLAVDDAWWYTLAGAEAVWRHFARVVRLRRWRRAKGARPPRGGRP